MKLALTFMLFATSLSAQPYGLADPAEYEAITGCMIEARETGQDIAVCRTIGSPACGEGATAKLDCSMATQFAWSSVAISVGGKVFERGASLPGFSRTAFLGTLEYHQVEVQATCFALPVGQEVSLADCLLDGEIADVRWMLATLDAMEAWIPDTKHLTPQASANLACMVALPSREGPEPCGDTSFNDACDDAACWWRQYQGWRELIAYFGQSAPGDLYDRLAANPEVPTFVSGFQREAPEVTLAELDTFCHPGEEAPDLLGECLFHAANSASGWLDLYQWYLGINPRLRGAVEDQSQ